MLKCQQKRGFDMSTYKLDLLFVDEPCQSGYVSPKAFNTDSKGNVLLTCKCLGYQEFEVEVNHLIKDLEEIKRKAKKRFSR